MKTLADLIERYCITDTDELLNNPAVIGFTEERLSALIKEVVGEPSHVVVQSVWLDEYTEVVTPLHELKVTL